MIFTLSSVNVDRDKYYDNCRELNGSDDKRRQQQELMAMASNATINIICHLFATHVTSLGIGWTKVGAVPNRGQG
jgi:hypothetical protein